jgi:hypothetical protein
MPKHPVLAASAILDSFRERYAETMKPGGAFPALWQAGCLADALRTLAEKSGRAFLTVDGEPTQGADYISVADVLAIADELEQAYFGELND